MTAIVGVRLSRRTGVLPSAGPAEQGQSWVGF